VKDQTDAQLLRAYGETCSEAAFAELVRRHVDFVYSAARRMVWDRHLAEDVTQGVFVALAKNSAQLQDRPVLSGWLHRTAQNIAAQTVRTIERRRAREQEAATMNELLAVEADRSWENIAPHLDAALGEVAERDRDALLLRYFEHKTAPQMAKLLGISDEAAQKRVSRAVDRLRECLAKRGITAGASGLTVLISTKAVLVAPAGLSAAILTTAHAGLTLTTTATATKAIAMTTLQKSLIAGVLVAAIGATIYEARELSTLRTEVRTLRQQPPRPEPTQQLTDDRGEAARQLAALRDDNERLKREIEELPKLRGEITALRNRAPELAQEKMAETEKENKALRDKTNQLWQSLVHYINQYSNSIAPDKRWAYSLEERKRFSLTQAEDGRYLLRRKGSDAEEALFNGGEFTSIGIGPNHIFVRQPAYKDNPEGSRMIDLRSGAVNGVYVDSELMSRPEVRGVRFMKPEEAWEFMK
jgi:RNA polymerase sigma factor (sigma-70 family)